MRRAAVKALVRENSEVVECVVMRPHVLVHVRTLVCDCAYHAVGHAECSKGDAWNEGRGIQIAKGRAEREIVDRVLVTRFDLGAITRWQLGVTARA